MRRLLAGFSLAFALFAAAPLSPEEQSMLAAISANTLKGHVSFLASDALEGRDTPSKGLEVAAEYIASQFRRFGLEPAGDEDYFQDAPYVTARQPMDGFELTVQCEGTTIQVPREHAFVSTTAALSLSGAEVVKVSLPNNNEALPARESVEGKVVLLVAGPVRTRAMMQKREALMELNPSLIVTAGGGSMLRPPKMREAGQAGPARPPLVTVDDADLRRLSQELREGPTAAKITVRIQAPIEEPLKLKNVIGVMRGSDAALRDTYILLTAHYDHLGISPGTTGDRINNGANDDASGVATVLAIAEALSKLPERPKRSVVFMTYFGEELGLYGSRYYARKPEFPLAKTVANLNFEHMGRTDDNEGPRVGKITATGFDYTTLGSALSEAGALTGVEAWQHEQNSDMFFSRSDNQALADAGIPAITVAVAWIFPDYHRPSDSWEKLNYTNMEKVVRTAALAVERIADDSEAPRWIESNPKTARYVKAWKLLHAGH